MTLGWFAKCVKRVTWRFCCAAPERVVVQHVGRDHSDYACHLCSLPVRIVRLRCSIGKLSMRIPWENFERETLDHLRALIRLDTTNPPGNERIAADYLARALSREGIEPVLIEPAPLRTSLIARIDGRDRSKPALMLSSHTDVVPVEASRWRRAPFGAELADGCIWGRGAI